MRYVALGKDIARILGGRNTMACLIRLLSSLLPVSSLDGSGGWDEERKKHSFLVDSRWRI